MGGVTVTVISNGSLVVEGEAGERYSSNYDGGAGYCGDGGGGKTESGQGGRNGEDGEYGAGSYYGSGGSGSGLDISTIPLANFALT